MFQISRVPHETQSSVLRVVTRGRLVETIEGVRHDLGVGCAILSPPGAGPRSASDCECLVIELPEHLAARTFVVEDTARVWALNLIEELETREPGWELVTEGLILEGLGRLERLRQHAGVRPAWVNDALDLARRQQPLGRIASIVGRHSSHVAREFRKHEGVSIGEYARRCRLELASRALRATRETISAIALHAGFCDQSHFTHAFRRLFGVTPAEYRRRAAVAR